MDEASRLLHQCVQRIESLYYSNGEESTADVVGMTMSAIWMVDMLQTMCLRTRECPGRYWRGNPEVVARITTARSEKKRKHTGPIEVGCTAKTPKFIHNYKGPSDGRDGEFPITPILCDTCGASLLADRRDGYLNKKNEK